MADRRDILVNLLGKETVSSAAGRAGKGLDQLGDAFDATKEDAQGLDAQIGDVEQSLKDLAVMFARTSDAAEQVDISKAIRKQEADLRRLSKARGLLGGVLPDVALPDFGKAGADGASKFGKAFVQMLPGSLQGTASVAGPLVAALAAPVAIGLSATIAGAVVGGVGIGGVVGGMAIASKHADVQKAGAQLGDTLTQVLQRSAISFVPATINALGDVRSEILGMEDDFQRIFSKASTYVKPLTAGVTGFAENLLPGVEDAVDRAGPVIDELASWGPRLGTLLSDVFSDFSDNASEGARALATFWLVFETGVRIVAGTITALSAVYGWMDKSLALLRGDLGTLAKYAAEEGAAKQGGDALIPTLQGIINGFGKTEQKTTDAVTALREWREELDKMTGTNLDARAAQRELESAIDDATAAVVENGKTAINHGAALDINSAKGRANAAALDSIARESNDAYDAIMTQTGSQELANAAADRGRTRFVDLAMKMGLSKEAAIRLADSLFRIKDRKVTVTANTAPALAAAAAMQARINNMSARINVYAEPSGGFGGGAHTGFGYSTGMASGGPVIGPGPKGVDSVWKKLAPGEEVMTAKEVDAAGGHGAVGAWRKSLLSGRPAPAMAGAARSGSGGGGAQRVEVVLRIDGSDRGIIGALLKGIKDAGGNPAVLGIGGGW